jgi:tetratricopeptide (TPR) repeat protein
MLALCAISFAIWATFTSNATLFIRQTSLSNIYALAVAAGATAAAVIRFGLRGVKRNSQLNQNGLADPDISQQTNDDIETIVIGDIPQEPAGFQPRLYLFSRLESLDSAERISIVYTLTGMPGVGKTQLMAAYARACIRNHWRLIAWVSAEDSTNLFNDLTIMANRLGITGHSSASANVGQMARNYLETNGQRCLVVFDNASDPDQIRPFIPAVGDARIMITSTKQSIANLGENFPVDVFNMEEALAFMAKRTGGSDFEGASTVIDELGSLPLALAQAAAVIKLQRLNYETYLQRLKTVKVEKLLTPVKGEHYPRGVAAAILMSMDAIQQSENTGLELATLYLISVLSTSGIPRDLLYLAVASDGLMRKSSVTEVSTNSLDQSLGHLADSSLISFSVDGKAIITHRLVMRIVRERMAREKILLEVCKGAARVLESRGEALDPLWEHIPESRDLVNQIMALYEHSPLYGGQSGRELSEKLLKLRFKAIELLDQLADDTGLAVDIAKGVVNDCRKIFGAQSFRTLSALNNLGVAYLAAGRVDDAIRTSMQALKGSERFLGPGNKYTLTARNNLASSYLDAGRVSEAMQLHEQNLADGERILGPDHPDVFDSRNNLALVYKATGQISKAIALFEKNLADKERVLGPNDYRTLGGLFSLLHRSTRQLQLRWSWRMLRAADDNLCA